MRKRACLAMLYHHWTLPASPASHFSPSSQCSLFSLLPRDRCGTSTGLSLMLCCLLLLLLMLCRLLRLLLPKDLGVLMWTCRRRHAIHSLLPNPPRRGIHSGLLTVHNELAYVLGRKLSDLFRRHIRVLSPVLLLELPKTSRDHRHLLW